MEAALRGRRLEVEVDDRLLEALQAQAKERGIGVNDLVTEMLREKVRPAA